MMEANADEKPDHANAGKMSPRRRGRGIGLVPLPSFAS
jgi:hypothetical protein